MLTPESTPAVGAIDDYVFDYINTIKRFVDASVHLLTAITVPLAVTLENSDRDDIYQLVVSCAFYSRVFKVTKMGEKLVTDFLD